MSGAAARNGSGGVSTTEWNEDRQSREKLARDEATAQGGFWRKAQQFAAQLPFSEDLLTAYYCAFDRNTPNHVRAALLGALAYFVLPFDVLPDLLPIVGFSDDAAVLAGALRLVWVHIQPAHREAARDALKRLSNQ
jgi:uncharacterized membrane protein YkvA (DUF1232 family)